MNFAGKSGSSNLSGFTVHGDSLADAVTIPDAHLLFSGDFQRSGADLIVSDQLHRVVVPNYFHGNTRPALLSPEGARLDPHVIDALSGHVQYAQAAGTAAAAKVIGHVVKMTGSASIVRNGVTITLNNGDVVYQNDVVQTGSGSTLGLVMIDGTTFNMSANARLMMNDLTYDAASTSNSSLFTLVQGAASFVAGQVAKSGDMKVSTPVATMGIRGTAVILDISAVDGTVSVSVVNQRDGQLHAVEVLNALGERIGTVTSNGSVLTLTPTASFAVIAQESNKSVAQVIAEFNAFQQLLSTYDIGKQLRPDTPAPTDGRRGDNDQQPLTKFAGSTISPIDSSVTKYNEPIGGTKDAKGGAADDLAALKLTGDGTVNTTKIVVNLGDSPGQVVELATTSIPFVVTPSPVSRISSGAGDHFGPVMSADGQFVTYDPDGAIYLFDRQTGTTRTIAAPGDGFTYGSPTISADGHFIVYQGSNGTQSIIFIYNNDASDAAHYGQITRLGPGGQPAVTGDGSKIVIEQGGSIALYDQQGHQLANITAAALGITGGLWKPAISADGHVIAFWNSEQPEPGGSGQLFTYDLSTATFRSIASTNTDVGSSAASFSADGHYIVYQSDAPGGHSEIYLVDLRSGQTLFHTANSEASYNPVISPDGHFIIFASDARLTADDSNNFTDIYVVDVSNPAHPHYKLVSVLDDGTQGDAASDLGATISAGGQFIAFGSRASNFSTGDNNGAGDIFVVDPSSGHSAIILEGRNSPATLTANGIVKLTGEHAGVTLGVSDSRISASFDANGDIHWTFNEQRSDFGSLQPGEIAVRNFVITLGTDRSTTEIPVKVNIYDVDQTPVPVADAAPLASPVTLAAGTEDTGYTVMATALLAGVIDIDGPALSITGLSISSGGGTIIDNHDGTFGYTPAANYNGPVVFNYTVSDGTLSASSTASLNIAAVNDAPVVTHAALTVSEGGTVVLSSSDIIVGDPDSTSFTFTVSSVSHGTFQIANGGSWADATTFTSGDLAAGHVRFVHDGGEDAPTFSVRADDGAGGVSSVAAGSVAFTNINDAPVVTHAALAVSEGGAVVLDPTSIVVEDTDSATFTFMASNVSHGKFQTTSDGSTWTDATAFSSAELGAGHVRFVHDGGEDAPTFSIRADDGAGGLSSVVAGSVAFTKVNDAPVVTHAALAVSEGGTVVLGQSDIAVSDPDSTGFSFTVSNVSQGKFQTEANGGSWVDATTFTTADLNASHVRFVHDGGEDAPTFSIRADDGAGGLSGVVAGGVTFTNINDAPVFSGASAGTSFAPNGAPVAVAVNVTASDVDSESYHGGSLTATVTAGGGQGDTLSIANTQFISVIGNTVMFDSDAGGPGDAVALGTLTSNFNTLTVTLNNNAGDAAVKALTEAIRFENATPAPAGGTRTVTFTLNDGGGTANGGHDNAYFQATVTVATVNHAPELSDSTLADVDEDTSAPAGETVGTLFAGKFHDIDQGSSLKGVAVIDNHATAAQGTWQYKTQQGGIWEDVGAVDAAHALIFATDTELRFVPAADFNGTPGSLQVVSVDDSYDDDFTTGAAQRGGRFTENVSDRGGSTPFSDQAVTLGITVTAVNDAPVASGSATLAAIDEDNASAPGNTIGHLFGGGFSDAADNQTAAAADGSHANTFAGIAISDYTPNTAKGHWEYATAGSNWVVLGAASATAAITLSADVALRFVPAANYNGAATALAAHLIEGGGAAIINGAIVDLVATGTGGSTHVSAGSVALGETINPVNDAPVIDGGDTKSVSVDENTAAVTTVVAHDPDGPSLTWSLLGGAGSPDALKFTIDPSTGTLSFKNAPDFEHPSDSNHNNIYTVQVNVSDGTLSDTQTLLVHVTDLNDNAPVITTSAFQFVAENHKFVTRLAAFDVDTVGAAPTFGIAEGADGSLFEIVNGNLQFKSARDFEHPSDGNHNNIYTVQVTAFDGLNSSSKTLFVQVTNVNEAPVLAPDSAEVTYIENAAPRALMLGATVTDPDNPANFDDGSLSVTLNGAVAGDELVLAGSGVSISFGNSVKVDGVTVGTISGNHSTHLGIDFNSNATDARVETVLHALAFDSTSDNPTSADRTATIIFNDGSNDGSGAALSDSSTVTIHVSPVNDAPHAGDDFVITNNSGGSTYQIPEWALLANDTDPDGSALDVTDISFASGFASITRANGNVTISDNSTVGGSFTYTASDGSLHDTAHVTVSQDAGTMNGGSGSEIFIGDSSGSTINANGGNDILIGNGGDDILNGGSGNDSYVFGLHDGRDVIHDTSGADTIRIEAGGAALEGLGFAENSAHDLVVQFDGQQVTVDDQFIGSASVGGLKFDGGASYDGYDLGGALYALSSDGGTNRAGTSGNDILAGDAGSNNLSGGDGNDLLFGNAGNDTLNGGSGNDLLVGGEGNDFMTGGAGRDNFVFAEHSGRDTISDFTHGEDKIDIQFGAPFDSASFESWRSDHGQQIGTDALIHLDVTHGDFGGAADHDTILLKNVLLGNLAASDFIVHAGIVHTT